MISACRWSGKNGRSALRICPWLSMSRNLHPVRVGDRLLRAGILRRAGERGAGVGEPLRLVGDRRAALRRQGQLAGDALREIARLGVDEVVGQPQRVDRCDDPEDVPLVRPASLLADRG